MVRIRVSSHSSFSNHSISSLIRDKPIRQTWTSPYLKFWISSKTWLKSFISFASPSVRTKINKPLLRPLEGAKSCKTFRNVWLIGVVPLGLLEKIWSIWERKTMSSTSSKRSLIQSVEPWIHSHGWKYLSPTLQVVSSEKPTTMMRA